MCYGTEALTMCRLRKAPLAEGPASEGQQLSQLTRYRNSYFELYVINLKSLALDGISVLNSPRIRLARLRISTHSSWMDSISEK